jgi:hypothetical protein
MKHMTQYFAMLLLVSSCGGQLVEFSQTDDAVAAEDGGGDGQTLGTDAAATADADAQADAAEPDVQADVAADVKSDVQADVADDAQADVQGDVAADAQPDVLADAQADVEPDVVGDIQADVQQDVAADAQVDAQADVADVPDIQPDVAADALADAPDALADVDDSADAADTDVALQDAQPDSADVADADDAQVDAGGDVSAVSAPPQVTMTEPFASDIPTCPPNAITVTFDQPMDMATLTTETFLVTEMPIGPTSTQLPVEGTVTYDPATNSAVFTPLVDLSSDTEYTITITQGVANVAGQALPAPIVWSFVTSKKPCQQPVSLGVLDTFVAVAGAGLTNSNSAGVTVLNGDVGLSATGTCMSDGSPCNPAGGAPIINGTLYQNDPAGKASAAKAALVSAYNDAAGRPPGIVEADLSGLTLLPGVYTSGSTMQIAVSGVLTLDGNGDPNAVWIFQVGSALTVNNNAKVLMVGQGKAANVFWAIGSSSTLGGGVTFVGNVLAQESNSVGTGSVVEGRLLCTSGQITLLSNTITLPAP